MSRECEIGVGSVCKCEIWHKVVEATIMSDADESNPLEEFLGRFGATIRGVGNESEAILPLRALIGAGFPTYRDMEISTTHNQLR